MGAIILETTQDDLEALKDIVQEGGFEMPGLKISIYKNRRGRYKNILLWCRDRRGVCKIEPMFVTTYNYELIEVQETKIKVKEPKVEASAF